jgi:hypothetical protein
LLSKEPEGGFGRSAMEKSMPFLSSQSPLQTILWIDAATCLAAGTLMAAGATPIAHLTAIPAPLLFWAGLCLFPVAALMGLVARQFPPSRPMVWLIILGNAAWVLASLAVIGIVTPNVLGIIFILAQAAVVSLLTWLEFSSAQRGETAAA